MWGQLLLVWHGPKGLPTSWALLGRAPDMYHPFDPQHLPSGCLEGGSQQPILARFTCEQNLKTSSKAAAHLVAVGEASATFSA